MTALSGPDPVFTRVIATLDASSQDVKTLASAVDLASRLDVEVAALFIEDINLFRLADLPFVRHVTVGSSVASHLTAEELQRDLNRLAARAAAELETSAVSRGVRWSFRVVRGLPSAELAVATRTEDLLVVGTAREVAGLPLRVGFTLRDAASRTSRAVLHVGLRTTQARPLVIARAGSPFMARTLAAAMRFTTAGAHDIAVLVAGTPEERSATVGIVDDALAAGGYRGLLRQESDLTIARLARSLREGGHDLLIIPADLSLPDGGLESLLREGSCGVLVVQ